MTKEMYCLITKQQNDDVCLEIEFEKILSLISYNVDNYIIGCDVNNESIYFIYLDNCDILLKIINFFKEHNLLISGKRIDNIIELINSDKKYLEVYLEGSKLIDKYICNHITTDEILDRMIESGSYKYEPLSIELEILSELVC